jgi:hypothetical protein
MVYDNEIFVSFETVKHKKRLCFDYYIQLHMSWKRVSLIMNFLFSIFCLDLEQTSTFNQQNAYPCDSYRMLFFCAMINYVINTTITAERKCDDNHFKCGSSGSCVSMNQTCDDQKDCPDGSDELAELCGNSIPIVWHHVYQKVQFYTFCNKLLTYNIDILHGRFPEVENTFIWTEIIVPLFTWSFNPSTPCMRQNVKALYL